MSGRRLGSVRRFVDRIDLTGVVRRRDAFAVDGRDAFPGVLRRLVLAVGLVSGLAGAAYVEVLRGLTRLVGPQRFTRPQDLLVFGLTGAAIGAATSLLGNPGDVELLVDNIHVMGGRSDVRDLRSLVPVSLLGIAVGSSIGPEAPLVQTTGSIGSWIGLRRGLRPADVRVLAITGMAAGFTVLFGAPLGSAIFALEILHRRGLEYYEALLPAGVGALVGYGVYVAVTGLGLEPIWSFPAPHRLHAGDLLVGVGAGVAGAAVAALFTSCTTVLRRLFGLLPPGVRPVTGGVAIAGLAFASPYALTFGEGQIGHVVGAKVAASTLLVAAAVKLVSSSTILSSGWRGGFIIPMFFLGVVLGSAVAHPLGVDRVVLMAALMAAVNVGVTKTPFGSSVVVAEMAGMRLLPSTLLAAIVALVLTSPVAMIETQRRRPDLPPPPPTHLPPPLSGRSPRHRLWK